MSRLANTILGAAAYGQHNQAPMVDLQNGGQMGPMTDLASYVSNTPYVRRNLIAVLVEAPRGFQDLLNPEIYVATLKALIELHAQSITGLNQTVELHFEEAPVGGAGEMQETVANSTRTRSTPSFTWTEKYGKPISYFLRDWITKLIMDPITKYPTVISQPQNKKPTDLLPDYTGATVLFYEPDPTHTKVVEAWLCTNMMPKTTGPIEGSRDMQQGGTKSELNIEFTALTQVGYGVMKFAQSHLDSMNLTGMNPNLQQSAVQAIEADVKAADHGYVETLDSNAKTRIPD